MSKRRAVITGLGWVTSLGTDVPSVWKDILAGRSGIRPVTRFNTEQYTVKFGGEVSDWTGAPHLDSRAMKRMDRFAQFGLASSIDAVTDSGIDFAKEDPQRCGVVIGSGVGGIEEFAEGHQKMLEKGPSRVSPFMIPKLMINAASANVSMHYGLQGVNTAAVTACASAGHAITDAVKAIAHDEADVIITGGSEAALTPLGLACFMTMRALSTRNDAPEQASRPWDKDRDGFVLSEGAGVMVLEEYEHARKRGAKIYGEIVGYAMNSDAGDFVLPDRKRQAECMKLALDRAGIGPDDIDIASSHATATEQGDIEEAAALAEVFGDRRTVAINNTKSFIGHAMGAAGALELLGNLPSFRDGVAHATINLDDPDPRCRLPQVVANTPRRLDRVRHILNNSFGMLGINSVVIVRRYPD